MFDRFIRLARARKALREARFLDALQQASDPLIEADRRAEQIREQATEQLLQRARQRLERGDLSTAAAEARRIRQIASGEAVDEVLRMVERAVGSRDQRANEDRERRGEFRKLVDAGELAAAEALLATLPAEAGDPVRMREHLAERRDEARRCLDGAADAAQRGDVRAALDGYLRALVTDKSPRHALREATLDRIAKAVAAAVAGPGRIERAAPEELGRALQAWTRFRSQLPVLAECAPGRALQQRLVQGVEHALQKPGSLEHTATLAEKIAPAALPLGPMADIVDHLVAFARAGGAGRVAGTTELAETARAAGFRRLASLADAQVSTHAADEEQLEAARQLVQEGRLDAARGLFVAFLQQNPLHDGVQKELEMVDESLAQLDRRLADVRLALRAGRLREACTEAMSLVGSARIAAEAQQILVEGRARMALVDKGLDEVRVALHGRAAATREGVRHCLKRLEELQKVQVDHPDLAGIIASVEAEIGALEQCERAAQALDRGDVVGAGKLLVELLAVRGQLLASERIDARLCEVGDRIASIGDRALADGRLVTVQRCGALLTQLGPVRDDFPARADEWRQEEAAREQHVQDLLRDARQHLAERDLASAERCVEEARGRWQEAAEVQSFAHRLQKLRKQTHTLEQVAAMTEDEDFLGARQKLDSMSEVPELLRTRVYDIKQNLARAQGLEGAFLLRVDEGGEQLVLRGESVSIGNVRQSRADLPVLANVAARHASIRRSMSFHGGMQDTVVAEDGEVRIGVRKVDKHTLQHGDRVQLGPALKLHYQRPTSRSLSSRLTLQGGFQVAGTDRVLLMKDRGRDGRILLGPGRDVHVAVAKATGEVEIYADNSGQMRVRCDQGGTIDGQVFKGEHPIAASQIVEAAGITFLLLPWQSGG